MVVKMHEQVSEIKRRNGTQTSEFGVSARLNHDSSKFYSSRLYQAVSSQDKKERQESSVPENVLNKIFCKSSEFMDELPDNSIHLMVTSPPYNVGKEYDQDLTLPEYIGLIKDVMKEVYRVLVVGGRACINIANIGRKPYIPLNSYITQTMLNLGFLMRGEIIWDKSASAGTSTARGSFKSATNPTLRDIHEYIMIFSKEALNREKNGKEDSIAKDEFIQLTKSIWSFPTASAKRIGHPAPFPEELPRRLIQFYTFKEDIILDQFMGGGQTALAALKCGRNYVGYDISEEYCKLAETRIKDYVESPLLAFQPALISMTSHFGG